MGLKRWQHAAQRVDAGQAQRQILAEGGGAAVEFGVLSAVAVHRHAEAWLLVERVIEGQSGDIEVTVVAGDVAVMGGVDREDAGTGASPAITRAVVAIGHE